MKGTRFAAWRRCAIALTTLVGASLSISGFADTGETKLRINLREAADLNSGLVTTLNQGTTVEVLDYQGEFAQVETPDGTTGFLKSKYLNIAVAETAPAAPEPAMETAAPVAELLPPAETAPPPAAPAEVAQAETAPAAPTAAPPKRAVEEIVVTGSRIIRNDLTANSPIAIFDTEDLKLTNTANAEEFLRDMPQFVAAVGANTNNGNPGVATVDLRNLGEERTLVLVDGKRFVPYDADGNVDLSMIPVSLIKRVEVITGGASAVYGSDAVAGVVNFILRKDFEGFETDLNYQVTQEGDGAREDISMTMGGNLADGRGNVVVNFSYTNQEEVTQGDRAFSLFALDDLLNPGGSTTTPWGTVRGPAVGAIDNDGAAGVQFDQDGNSTLVDTNDPFNFNPFNLLQAPQRKWTATGLANVSVTDNISAFSRVSLANSQVDTIIAPSGTFFFPFQLNVDNPFLSQQAQMVLSDFDAQDDNDGLVDISFGRRLVELGTRDSLYENTAFQIVTGLEGEAFNTARWEVFGQYGRTSRVQNFQNDVNFANTQQSMLATTDANGNIVCTDPSGGCVPGNYFGPGLLSAEAASFIRLNIQENNETEQYVYGANLTGDTPLQVPSASSPVAYAVGFETRRENSKHLPDDNYANGNAIGFGSSTPIDAEFSVDELYGEISIPVLDNVTLEGGLRIAQYDNSTVIGGVRSANDFDNTSFKLMGEWQATDALRVRAGFQRAVRAPNLSEIGQPITPSTGDLSTDPCALNNPVGDQALTDLCVATGVDPNAIGNVPDIVAGQINNYIGGNPGLEPEEAESYTLGLVYAPDTMPLTLAFDYFQIEITDAIEQVSEQNVVNACYFEEQDVNGFFCSRIARSPIDGSLTGGTETGVDVTLINAGITAREGFDLSGEYSVHLRGGGTIDLGLALTYLLESSNQEGPQFESNDCVGLVGNTCTRPEPELRFIQNTRWTNGPWSVNLRWQFLDKVQQDAIALEGTPASDYAVPTIDRQHYFDLSGTFALNQNYSFRAGIFNLLDDDPPVVGNDYGGTAENSGNTYPATYDPLGRTFGIGFNAKF